MIFIRFNESNIIFFYFTIVIQIKHHPKKAIFAKVLP